MASAGVQRLTMQVESLRSFRERIPKVVHFIKSDTNGGDLFLVHYMSIRSAWEKIRPTRIKFHTRVRPSGFYWEKLLAAVPLEVVIGAPSEMSWNGNELKHVAHQSDSWRLEILIREGGIYLDWCVCTPRRVCVPALD